MQFGRPSPFDRIAGLAKTVLMLWGALTFGAAAGTAAYYFAGTGGPVLVSQMRSGSSNHAPVAARDVALAEIPPHLRDYVATSAEEEPAPIVEARLPRPRPDEPVVTGSIERRASPRRRARAR